VEALAAPVAGRRAGRTGIVAGWSINELDPASRNRVLPLLLKAARQGAPVLIIEPIARGISPWWDDWARAFIGAGGRADEWKFEVRLPAQLAAIDAGAGFQRE